jgi:hypothetical protein
MGVSVATVQEDILKAFYDKLAKSPAFDKATVEAVWTLMSSDKKLKANDLVAVLAKDNQEGGP